MTIIKDIMIKNVKKNLNSLQKKKKFRYLKKKFLCDSTIKNFKLLINYWTEYINKTIGNYKYNFNYNIIPSITNKKGHIIFKNNINFTSSNLYTNDFNNLTDIDYDLLFGLYKNKLINFTPAQQIKINKAIKYKNKKWKTLDNFYYRYTPGTIEFESNQDGYAIWDTYQNYDFLCGYTDYAACPVQNGGSKFPMIPKASTTSFSSDRYGNFYILDTSYNYSKNTFILTYNPKTDINTYIYYLWGKVESGKSGNIVCGCTGLYANDYSSVYQDPVTYYGSCVMGQYQNVDSGTGYLLETLYINKRLAQNGYNVTRTIITTLDNNKQLKTQTGTDSGIYSSNGYSDSNLITTGIDETSFSLQILSQNCKEEAKYMLSSTSKSSSIGLYGSACVKNGDIFIFTSINGAIYYCGTSDVPNTPILATYAAGSEIPLNYIATGITSYTVSGVSYLYVAYYMNNTLSDDENNYISYIYRYTVDNTGVLTQIDYITGGLYGNPFLNIGYMTTNMNKDLPYTISYYEYTNNYSISRIVSLNY